MVLVIGMGLGGVFWLIVRCLRSVVVVVGHVECAGGGWLEVTLSWWLVKVGMADAVREGVEIVVVWPLDRKSERRAEMSTVSLDVA